MIDKYLGNLALGAGVLVLVIANRHMFEDFIQDFRELYWDVRDLFLEWVTTFKGHF